MALLRMADMIVISISSMSPSYAADAAVIVVVVVVAVAVEAAVFIDTDIAVALDTVNDNSSRRLYIIATRAALAGARTICGIDELGRRGAQFISGRGRR